MKTRLLAVLWISQHPQLRLPSLINSDDVQRGETQWQPYKSASGEKLDSKANVDRRWSSCIVYTRAQMANESNQANTITCFFHPSRNISSGTDARKLRSLFCGTKQGLRRTQSHTVWVLLLSSCTAFKCLKTRLLTGVNKVGFSAQQLHTAAGNELPSCTNRANIHRDGWLDFSK